jgi:hypothetical protein
VQPIKSVHPVNDYSCSCDLKNVGLRLSMSPNPYIERFNQTVDSLEHITEDTIEEVLQQTVIVVHHLGGKVFKSSEFCGISI